jgi:hypothetical protein
VIYECPYCREYFVAGERGCAQSEMARHQALCKMAYPTEGRIQLRFTWIRDVNRIREYVIRSLPYVYRCRFCGLTLENAGQVQRRAHIMDEHVAELVGPPQ